MMCDITQYTLLAVNRVWAQSSKVSLIVVWIFCTLTAPWAAAISDLMITRAVKTPLRAQDHVAVIF